MGVAGNDVPEFSEAPAPAAEEIPADMPAVGLEPAISDQPAPGNPGELMLQQAQMLMAAGNFTEARQVAEQARRGGFNVEAEAEDLISQIALTEQTGALKLYEAALDALRKGENDRAHALLSEVAASGVQDPTLMQKVQDLMVRIPTEKPGTATIGAVEDVEAVKAAEVQCRGRDEGGRIAPPAGDRSR